jgi:hypothetical protein
LAEIIPVYKRRYKEGGGGEEGRREGGGGKREGEEREKGNILFQFYLSIYIYFIVRHWRYLRRFMVVQPRQRRDDAYQEWKQLRK